MSNKTAHKHLSNDPVMKKLIKQFDLPAWSYNGDLFLDLIGSIIGQQLSVKAGTTIENRFLDLFPKRKPTPKQILKTPDEKLRKCGMSYGKIKYIKGICTAVIKKQVNFESLREMEDEEIIVELVKLKGVGRWTAEMFIMFCLGRPDIFSFGDLGLKNAVAKHYGIDRDDLKKIEKITIKWSPHRTLACRYLWKSLDNEPK